MTSHGIRATASTLLNESGRWHPDAIERALAHNDNNNVRAAYHRGSHWAERVVMAQWWSDYLDQLRAGRNQTIVHPPGRDPRLLTNDTGSTMAMPPRMIAGGPDGGEWGRPFSLLATFKRHVTVHA